MTTVLDPDPQTRIRDVTRPDDRVRSTSSAARSALPSLRVRERAALATLLGATAVLYLWGLGESGWPT